MPHLRKILTKDEMLRKEHKKRRIMGIVISLVMLSSIAAFALMEYGQNNTDENQQKYKDYKFTLSEGGWQTKINNNLITTSFLPQDVENISSPAFIQNSFDSVYFIADTFEEKGAAEELSRVIQADRKQLACLPEEENMSYCNDLPLKNCSDASPQTGIIIVEEKNESQINYNNYCLTVSGNSSEIIKSADKAIFVILGII